MHQNGIFSTRNLVAVVTVSILLVTSLLSYFSNAQFADSSSGDNVAGYAWSDTIGWISLNCTNTSSCATSDYGVAVSSIGLISGQAWSENIGWVSFDAADVASCPSGSCNPSLDHSTGVISGWARALSGGTAESGGWDGFISLSGAGYGINSTSPNTGCSWSGFAWGSDVVGWVDFSGVTGLDDACSQPDGSITATACQILPNESVCSTNLNWNSQNLISTPSVLVGTTTLTPVAPNGSGSGDVSLSDRTVTLYDGSNMLSSVSVGVSCTTGTIAMSNGICVSLPVLNLGSVGKLIRNGNTAIIDIDITAAYPVTCTFLGALSSAPNIVHPGSGNLVSYPRTTNALTSATIAQVTCTADADSLIAVTKEIRVEVVPTYQEV